MLEKYIKPIKIGNIEVKNNTSLRVTFQSADYTTLNDKGELDYLNDFEWRYPEDLNEPTQLAEFAAWVCSTDPEQATNENLDSSVTYGGVTYTTDSAEYRLAKFKAEAADYVEVQSMLYYYLFT